MTEQAILITTNDAARLLSTTRRRLLKLAREGQIPFVDLGDDEPRFSPEELRTWVIAETREGGHRAK